MTWKDLPAWVLREAGVMRERDLVYVPYFTPAGELHNRRVVADDGRRWWEHSGRDLIPFGLKQLIPPYTAERQLFLCEGESHALALRATDGWAVDVLGLPGASSWRPEWRSHVEPWAVIYVLGDGDDAGRSMNERVKHDTPWDGPSGSRTTTTSARSCSATGSRVSRRTWQKPTGTRARPPPSSSPGTSTSSTR
jgi:hypothetical protein